MMNGGKIETHEYRDLSNEGKKNKTKSLGNTVETKVNFFDPSEYEDHGFDNNEDDQILEAKVDPEEWKKELDRVYVDLVNIDKEIELNR